ncbi:MAG TPA: PilX N-terminal domain-containing pilus assembly protein [Candidatus Sulfotelmatobacter sp.]|jgi:Tfp pilus assembly protein PilX|nr:PilX N-terminal domain-containing pilus assembly protein [Candidatus Sulfotelmatobacter sp.]
MNSNRETIRGQKGVALIISLVVLLLLSTIAASLIFATQTEMWASVNYRILVQSRYAAEAGAQQGINWIEYNYTPPTSAAIGSYDMTKTPVLYNGAPVVLSAMSGVTSNYPDSTVRSAFSTALSSQSVPGVPNSTYSVTAELLYMRAVTGSFASPGTQYLQTWQITSQGSLTGVKSATTQVIETIDKTGTPIFVYAAFATSANCSAINFSGGTITDSYNSSNGTYAATHSNTDGNVGTNGNMNMSGTTTINGMLSGPNTNTGACPDVLTTSGGAVTGGLVALTNPPSYPTPPAPSPTPPPTNQNISNICGGVSGCTDLAATVPCPHGVAFAPGQFGNVNVAGGTCVTLSAGTYNINSLTLSGGSPLILNSGPVILNIAGTGTATAINLSGGSVTNNTGAPANFQIVYGGTDAVILSGGSASSAVVYSPNAPITMSGSSAWYGAVIGSSVLDSGGAAIHYDAALQNNFVTVGNFNPTAFTWSKN